MTPPPPTSPRGTRRHAAPPARRAARPNYALRRAVAATGLVVVILGGARVIAGGDDPADVEAPVARPAAMMVPATSSSTTTSTTIPQIDLEGCTLVDFSIRNGAEGDSVECSQKALWNTGYYTGAIDGVFDDELEAAVRAYQKAHDLVNDGVLGASTAEGLGIWPGRDFFVVRTPPPAEGAVDSMGFLLSEVASTGADAPPLPENAGQGTGKRIVYSRLMQRVWAVDANENIVRSYLVSGSVRGNEEPGVHRVYSKSEVAYAFDFSGQMSYMVRYQKTELGNIGFHGIPVNRADDAKYQTDDQLGTQQSAGCQRQSDLDARFMWAFSEVGTAVWVL